MRPSPVIVFMGTPDFSVPCLLALHEAGHALPLVVTQPDRPKGRGRSLAPPPVKLAAEGLGLAVEQPGTVRDEGFIERIRAVAPDFLVVVAFGQILPKALLDIPRRGAVNVHASLLPKYRGPAPIQWAMIRGEAETGVTTMLMDIGVDTGDILLQKSTTIGPEDTADSMHARLSHMGSRLLVETLHGMWQGTLYPRAQPAVGATYAPMLKKEDGRIDWGRPPEKVDMFIRAMTPWPGAFCFFGERRLKIISARPLTGVNHREAPGTILRGFPDELRVACEDGATLITELQGASGKRLRTADFLRGHPIAPGSRLT